TTDGSGNATFSLGSLPTPDGTVITSTATDPSSNTSEFSGQVTLSSSATTFTVNSTGDGNDANFVGGIYDGVCETATSNGICTLRAALQEANAYSGADTVAFNIVGGGAQTITLASDLPNITQAMYIDGTTQPGSSCGNLWGSVSPVWNLVIDASNNSVF